jgi:hypothetical protein
MIGDFAAAFFSKLAPAIEKRLVYPQRQWDWMETPAGMVYIDTRRQDDLVGVRVATYSQDRVVSGIAPAATRKADRQLIREIARNAVRETVAGGFPGS